MAFQRIIRFQLIVNNHHCRRRLIMMCAMYYIIMYVGATPVRCEYFNRIVCFRLGV